MSDHTQEIRAMSTKIEQGEAGIREFGDTIATAIERLDNTFNTSFRDLRYDVNRLAESQTRLIESQEKLTAQMDNLISALNKNFGQQS
jgi:hypothetical protein